MTRGSFAFAWLLAAVAGTPASATPWASPLTGLPAGSEQPVLRSRLTPEIRQSYNLSYASNGAASVSQGVYLNQMTWRLGEPVTLHLDLGFYTPLAGEAAQAGSAEGSRIFLPRLGLEWRPTARTALVVNYSQMPSSTAPAWSRTSWPDWF